MEFKFVVTPNGILKIIEAILLIVGFALILDRIIELEKCIDFILIGKICGDAPWEYYVYAVIAILVGVLIVVAVIGHLIMPAWMKLIRAKVAKAEIGFCVVAAILVLVGSACLASDVKDKNDKGFQELDKQITAVVLGFVAVVLLVVECIFLRRIANSPSL
ncbi:uncharacterized protein [Antedon mediterranea]|uniref:uncharacterized protein n=1 Tax=Antedon mediterranea TaxID=105859 RepID=UPI003AF9E0DF